MCLFLVSFTFPHFLSHPILPSPVALVIGCAFALRLFFLWYVCVLGMHARLGVFFHSFLAPSWCACFLVGCRFACLLISISLFLHPSLYELPFNCKFAAFTLVLVRPFLFFIHSSFPGSRAPPSPLFLSDLHFHHGYVISHMLIKYQKHLHTIGRVYFILISGLIIAIRVTLVTREVDVRNSTFLTLKPGSTEKGYEKTGGEAFPSSLHPPLTFGSHSLR